MIVNLINWWKQRFRKDVPSIPTFHNTVRRERLCEDLDITLVKSGWMSELYREFPKGSMVRKTLQQQQSLLRVGGIIHTEWIDATKLYMSIEVMLLDQPTMWVRGAMLQDDKLLTIQVWESSNVSDLMFVAFSTFFDSIGASRETFMGSVMVKSESAEKPTKSTVVKLVSNRGHANEPNPQ